MVRAGRGLRDPLRISLVVATAFLAIIVAERPAHATTITVTTATDVAFTSTTSGILYPNDGVCSLRAAIQSALWNSNAHDSNCQVGVSGGLDIVQISPSLTGQTMTMTAKNAQNQVEPFEHINSTASNNLKIVGPTINAGDFVIDAAGAVRPFVIGFGNLEGDYTFSLANITVRGGNGKNNGNAWAVDGDGGAIFTGNDTTITLDNVVFRDNTVSSSTARGGAIFLDSSTLISNGGGFISNQAIGSTTQPIGHGGAIYMATAHGPVTLEGYAVLFESNSASFQGGAVAGNFQSQGSALLQRVLALNNSAQSGGVFGLDPSSTAGFVSRIHDSTLTGNSAPGSGGVFRSSVSSHRFEFLRNTFVNNTAGTGGLFSGHGGLVANSIIVDSTCSSQQSTANFSGGGNLSGGNVSGCSIINSGGAVTGLSTTLAQNGGPDVQRTFALQAGSNAIDSGSQAYCGTIDARSVPRGVNGAGAVNSPAAGDCDVGAYEYANVVVNWVTGTSSVTEGQQANIGLRVSIPSREPLAAPLSVPVSRLAASTARGTYDYTGFQSSITIPQGTQHGATIVYSIVTQQDDVAEFNGEQLILELGAATGVATAEPRQHTMVLADDDQSGVVVADGGNGTTVSEAATGTRDSFTVSLRSKPDFVPADDPNGTPADVVMTVRPDRDCTLTVGGQVATVSTPRSVTIPNADWKSGTAVAVNAVDDLYDEDFRDESATHNCTITYTFSSPDPVYNNTTDRYDVRVADNDVAGVTVTQTGGSTDLVEGGATDTYAVVLHTPPDPGDPLPSPARGATTVTAGPSAQCQVTGAPSFTEANWSTPQMVVVTARHDLTVELAHTCPITNAVAGGDPIYDDLDAGTPVAGRAPGPVTANVQDYNPPDVTDDPPHVVITAGTVSVDEGSPGTSDTFTVELLRQPLNANVTVDLTSLVDPRDPGPGAQVLLQKGVTQPAKTLTLTFTPQNWNTAQTVNVVVNDDDFDEDQTHAGDIAVAIASTAPGFNNPALRAVVRDTTTTTLDTGSIPVTVSDDDTSGVTASVAGGSLSLSEGGASGSYSFALDTHPYADVTVTLDPSDGCDIGEGSGAPATIEVPHASWSAARAVSVTAVDDQVVGASPRTCTITHAVASTDLLYHRIAVANVEATVLDDDLPIIALATGGGVSVTELDTEATDE